VRIASLVPSITLALHILGLDDQIVARTDYCIHPQHLVEKVPTIGGTKNPDLQKIRELHPDLVIANTDEQRKATLQELQQGPWDLLVTETDSLDDVATTWTTLGQATGTTKTAEGERRRIEAALEKARAQSRKRPPLRVLVPVWKDPWMAAGGGTYLGDLLAACGLQNVLDHEQEKWVLFADTLDKQEAHSKRPTKGPFKDRAFAVLEAPPQAVLLPTEPYEFQEEHRGLFQDLGVPAERVFIVDGELLTWWLSHTAKALESFTELATKIHDEALPT
jgi:ABC-type Fe3+-hydroxamate transport system substrate-binding protein